MSRRCDGQASSWPHWIDTLPRELNQLTKPLTRAAEGGCRQRVLHGCHATGCRSNAADFSGPRRLGYRPRALADWILESGGAASCL
jgi:hypothetical protein